MSQNVRVSSILKSSDLRHLHPMHGSPKYFNNVPKMVVRILRFYLCGLLKPYFSKIMLAKCDSAIADVPTNKYVNTAGIHYYMYESYSK
jgi:hypothetical protein